MKGTVFRYGMGWGPNYFFPHINDHDVDVCVKFQLPLFTCYHQKQWIFYGVKGEDNWCIVYILIVGMTWVSKKYSHLQRRIQMIQKFWQCKLREREEKERFLVFYNFFIHSQNISLLSSFGKVSTWMFCIYLHCGEFRELYV